MRTVFDSVDLLQPSHDVLARAEARLAALDQRFPSVTFAHYLGETPEIEVGAWVFPSAAVIGNARLAAQASVWFGAVLRADINHITVGARSNLQDGVIVHLGDRDPTVIGEDVTVGHGAVLHGCTIQDAVLIGIRATVLDGAHIGEGSIIGAGAVVPAAAVIEPYSLVLGVPGKVIRRLDPQSAADHRALAAKYVRLATNYGPARK